MIIDLTREQLILINLLLRIAVMAGMISFVFSFRFVGEMLVDPRAARSGRLRLGLLLGLVFVLGVVVRRISAQGAMDLSLEGSIIAGFLGGVWVGGGVGAAIGLACLLFGETAALPLYLGVGLLCGLVYSRLGRRGEIWSFSLNPFFVVSGFVEKLASRRLDHNVLPFVFALLLAYARYAALRIYRPRGLLYGYLPGYPVFVALDLLVTLYAVGIALRMANATRTELLLHEEEQQLSRARLQTLRSQINPHFLFNTLNSIAALIRTDAEKAREMTRRLSAIFRKALDDGSETHSLEEELRFIDDYLSIERVRFGQEKCRVESDVDEAALGRNVPTMILQPVVENAIKHGISRRAEGGAIRIRARADGDGVVVEIENDGPPAAGMDLRELMERGVGLRNVAERLRIYACESGRLEIAPRDGGGVVVRLRIPGIDERGESIGVEGDNCR
ncbi:MAG: histidine kinase [Candidatus Krumholzibacteriota bacterium]|nr:histidine kinase [Candidatus Krumholzibacteriota bacterium]